MKIKLLLSLAVVFMFLSSFGQCTDQTLVKPEKRQEWINQMKKEIVKLNPDTVHHILEASIVDLGAEYYTFSYRLKTTGLIQISPNEWIYLTSSSSHNNPEVGDITIAIDQDRQFYINEGHVCGGIVHFRTETKIDLKTSKQFFEYFRSDIDSIPWSAIPD